MTSRGQSIDNEMHVSGQKEAELTRNCQRTENSVHSHQEQLEPIIQSLESNLYTILLNYFFHFNGKGWFEVQKLKKLNFKK